MYQHDSYLALTPILTVYSKDSKMLWLDQSFFYLKSFSNLETEEGVVCDGMSPTVIIVPKALSISQMQPQLCHQYSLLELG